MQVFIQRIHSPGKAEEMTFTGTVSELLTKLGINAETVLVTRKNELLTEDTPLREEDEINILSVISGG